MFFPKLKKTVTLDDIKMKANQSVQTTTNPYVHCLMKSFLQSFWENTVNKIQLDIKDPIFKKIKNYKFDKSNVKC